MRLFPNPANGEVQIELAGVKTVYYYRIINALGQEVQRGMTKNGETINVDQISKGTYFVLVSNGEQIIDKTSLVIE